MEIAHESNISKTMKEKLKTLWIESFESNNLPVYKLQTNFIICILQHTRADKKKVDTSKTEAFSLTVNISVNSLSNLTTKDSFRICFSWGFWNWPWLLNLIKNWRRYWQLKRSFSFRSVNFFLSSHVLDPVTRSQRPF